MKVYLLATIFLFLFLLSGCGKSVGGGGGVTVTISEVLFTGADNLTIRYAWVNSTDSRKTVSFDTKITFVNGSTAVINEVEIWDVGSGVFEKITLYKSTTNGGVSTVQIVGVSSN